MRGLVFIGLIGVVLFKGSSAVICKSDNKHCTDGKCKDLECTHGGCLANGSCVCHQCFSGLTCDTYVDEYHPYFLKEEETIYIEKTHKGLVYEARARDDDNFKTCLPHSTLPCPCGEIAYEIMMDGPGEGIFLIDHSIGDLSLAKDAKLKAGDTFKVDIATSNYKEDFPFEQKQMSIDILKLNIVVRESNSVESLLRMSEMQEIDQSVKYIYEADSEMEMEKVWHEDEKIGVNSLNRVKRTAYAGVNGTTNITLQVLNSVFEPIQPGTTIDFQMTVILPQIPSASGGMDLTVEIFVMDAVTGITTFALCNVTVASIGSAIGPVTVTEANQNTAMEYNPTYRNFYDRATIDFGTVVNTAATFGGPEYSDSSIIIYFTATMIPNALYTNSTAIITAGAEYNNENYVWVSQASFNYSNTAQAYPSNVTIMGPDTINQYSGGTYDVLAYVSTPYDIIEIEVFTPQNIHDMFSITSLNIVSKGANLACILGRDNYTIYKSVSGLTNFKYSVAFPIIVSNLNYANNLATESTELDNLIQVSFTVYMYGAAAGSIVTIGAGLSIGTSTIWTALANVTVGLGVIPPSVTGSLLSLTAIPVDTSTAQPSVNVSMTATWDVQAVLPAASNAEISCTATPGASSKICGVNYGSSGKYVATFPNLTEIVIYNPDGSATWNFITNTSAIGPSQTRITGQDYVSLEITVVYLGATPAPATVACGSATVTLTAMAGPEGVGDVSGVTTILGQDSNWYYPSQAGLMATLTFPAGGLGYSDITLETSGDFFVTSMGAEVCRVDIVSMGRGIGCAASTASSLYNNVGLNITTGSNTSRYNDAAVVDFGPMCSSKRDAKYLRDTDYNLVLRVIYDLPKIQTVVTGALYNISLGVLLGSNAIWTGWGSFKLSNTLPEINTTFTPLFTVLPPASLTQNQYVPFVIKAYIKTYPGTIGTYMITVNSSVPDTIDICRLAILNVGYNYACIDTNPYGKETDPTQRVTIIHAAGAWGASAALNLGIIRNFGTGVIEPSLIADQDTIEVAIYARGSAVGAGTITVNLVNRFTNTPVVTSLTIQSSTAQTPNSLSMNISGLDGTMDFYTSVMKIVVVTINVPSQPQAYSRPVKMQFENNSPLMATICFAAVVWAGANVPCAAPALMTSNATLTTASDIVAIDFGYLCYVPMSNNASENLVKIQVGIMPAKGETSVTVNAVLYENAVPTTQAITLTSGGTYVPGNFSVENITLFIADNATVTTVKPGQLIWLGLDISIPRGLTIPVTIGIMAQSSAGHAQATVQGFRWGTGQGKNIQCLEAMDMYNVTYMQNASIDNITMFHISQKDTLIADLKYITNTGLTYITNTYEPQDDVVQIQAEILIANHELLAVNSIIPVSFALKVGNAIIVAEKNYTLIASTVSVMVLNSTLIFADPTFNSSIPLQQYQKLNLTLILHHILNQSTEEAYGAIVRIMLPNYIIYANESNAAFSNLNIADTFSSNISETNLTVLDYLDFDIGWLFFTDILQINFTVTVDPYNTMPKGLGTLDSTVLFRFACKPSISSVALEYCGNTAYLNYQTIGSECFFDLNSTTLLPCQFVASTAIDATVAPQFSVTASGWSPATRDTSVFKNYLIIDFLRMTRITKVVFSAVAGKRGVGTYQLQYSYDGNTFMPVVTCQTPLSAATENLPSECRFQSRYVKMIILSATTTDDTVAIGVSALWYGCYTDAPPTATIPCSLTSTTLLTTTVGAYRHMAYDTANSIIYFCDYNPKKSRMVCYSSLDAGNTWTALPSYIGSLVGFDSATSQMYAYDTRQVAMVSSSDGANWALVDATVQATVATTATTPSVIYGEQLANFVAVVLGPWTADFTGLQTGGVYKVKWGSCCS